MKKYLFSIFLFASAIAITLWVTIGCLTFANDDDFFYTLLVLNCLSPVLLLITIGIANLPRKEKQDESNTDEH